MATPIKKILSRDDKIDRILQLLEESRFSGNSATDPNAKRVFDNKSLMEYLNIKDTSVY